MSCLGSKMVAEHGGGEARAAGDNKLAPKPPPTLQRRAVLAIIHKTKKQIRM